VKRATLATALLLALAVAACVRTRPGLGADAPPVTATLAWDALPGEQRAFLDSLEERTFRFFWDKSDSTTGLAPDRWPTRSFVSVGAIGFALTAYPIGAERGYVPRAAAAERVRRTLAYLLHARQDSASTGVTGYRGFFYHFLVPETGERFERVELSTQDSALLFAGALFCASYFDRDDPAEREVRALAESLYARADWRWASPRPPTVALGWSPEEGFLPYDWGGLNETAILHILALGAPAHPSYDRLWSAYTRSYKWGTFEGQEHLGFAPLFGHQYSQVWIDFRGIRDSAMAAHGLDYFENSRRATLAQRAYAIRNPSRFRAYGKDLWGLTACDGPLDSTFVVDGVERRFHSYEARGASFVRIEDDGTVAPTAAAGSLPFAPEVVAPTLLAMRGAWGRDLYGEYGFVDAFNPTLDVAIPMHYGRIVAGKGWFDTDVLGIDEGPIVAMIENYRSGLVWRTMRRNEHLVRGLRRAGFTGGWLDSTGVGR
jgi:hypothetical protein